MLQTRATKLSGSLKPLVRAQRRTHWHCSTLISHSPSSLLSHIEALPRPAQDSVTLFALSKNTPQELVGRVRGVLGKEGRTSLGTLAEVVPSSLLSRLAPSLPSKDEAFHLSLATYSPTPPSSRAIPFRSTLQGRPPVALGREIRPSENEDQGVNVGFEKFLRGEKWGFGESERGGEEGVDELRGVECVAP